MTSEPQRLCPHCDEMITHGLKTCPACGEALPQEESGPAVLSKAGAAGRSEVQFLKLFIFAGAATVVLALCRLAVFYTAGAFAGLGGSKFTFAWTNVAIFSVVLPLWVAAMTEWIQPTKPRTRLLLLLLPAVPAGTMLSWWWAAYIAIGLATCRIGPSATPHARTPEPKAALWPFYLATAVLSVALIASQPWDTPDNVGKAVVNIPNETLMAFTGCAWAYACAFFGRRM